jgi:hypothetical protein
MIYIRLEGTYLKGEDKMEWNLFGGLAIAIFLIRWDQDQIKLTLLVKEIILIGIFVLILSFFLDARNYTFSIFSLLPDKLEIWAGALLFISFIGALTHRGWRSIHAHHTNHRHY